MFENLRRLLIRKATRSTKPGILVAFALVSLAVGLELAPAASALSTPPAVPEPTLHETTESAGAGTILLQTLAGSGLAVVGGLGGVFVGLGAGAAASGDMWSPVTFATVVVVGTTGCAFGGALGTHLVGRATTGRQRFRHAFVGGLVGAIGLGTAGALSPRYDDRLAVIGTSVGSVVGSLVGWHWGLDVAEHRSSAWHWQPTVAPLALGEGRAIGAMLGLGGQW